MTALGTLGWYVYAVVAAPDAAAAAARAGAVSVLPGASVGVVTASGLAALVSLVPVALFQAEAPGAGAADPAWVAARAAAHHEVVTAICEAGPCLPFGFGTIFGAAEAVRGWLETGAARLGHALAAVTGQAEWAVSLAADPVARVAWLRAHDPALRGLADSAAAAGPGTRFLIERQAARAETAALLASDAEQAAWLGADLTGRGWVARQDGNAAWSVLAAHGADLPAMLADLLPRLNAAGLSLRVAGPFPPYAFARAAWQEHANA
jgi:hypothetical protein